MSWVQAFCAQLALPFIFSKAAMVRCLSRSAGRAFRSLSCPAPMFPALFLSDLEKVMLMNRRFVFRVPLLEHLILLSRRLSVHSPRHVCSACPHKFAMPSRVVLL